MKKFIYLILLLAVGCAPPPPKQPVPTDGRAHFEYFKYQGHETFYDQNPLPAGHFNNPILSGFYPDPSICRKGTDYYMVNSTFAYFPGVPIFHSTDLVHWQPIGHVLDRPEQFPNTDQPVSYGIFAPAISYNPSTDLFYMITTYVGGGGNFVVTAKDPAGPWSNPTWLPQVPGIDPSIFFDDDGKAYVVNNGDPDGEPLYQGHRAIWIQEFDARLLKTIGPRQVLRDAGHKPADKPIWIEGPHLYKVNGMYYLMAAEGGTGYDHSEVVFRSRSPWGPFEANPANPILTQRDLPAGRSFPVTNTGHADLFQDPDGNWWAVFLGCRPYNGQNEFNLGRETFLLPATWENGWPLILPKGQAVDMQPKLPAFAQGTTAPKGTMQTGNFSFVDGFEGAELHQRWVFLRTPTQPWWHTDTLKGGLWLDARPTNLRQLGRSSFVAVRQRHHNINIETRIHFMPRNSTDFAGLSLFQNETNHISFGVGMVGGSPHIILQKAKKLGDDIAKEIVASLPLPTHFSGVAGLRAQCREGAYHFAYQQSGSPWQQLPESVAINYLSTAKAGGFVGAMLGLYASSAE